MSKIFVEKTLKKKFVKKISLEKKFQSEMGFKCNYCPKVFTIKTNRSRHERNFHAVEKELPVFT